MKLKDLTKEELEAMSYDDIAMMILEESKKQMKVNELFKKVCETLGLTEDEFVEKLPAFFDVLSTDHRFIMLENGLWDLKTRHSTKIVIDQDEEEEDDEIIEIENEPEEEKEDENIYADEDDQDDDLTDDNDDLKDLVIIEEDEEQMV